MVEGVKGASQVPVRSEYFRQFTISFAYKATGDGMPHWHTVTREEFEFTLTFCQTIMRGERPLTAVGVTLPLSLSAFRPDHTKPIVFHIKSFFWAKTGLIEE